MENMGWIKLHRQLLDNPIVMKDAEHLAIWVWLLLKATHNGVDVMFRGKRTRLKPGQLTTGRNVIAKELGINRNKVERVLKLLENEHQIEQQTSSQCRLISILSWDKYQNSEQPIEPQVSNKRATSEQQVSTKQEGKNEIMKNVIYKNDMKGDIHLNLDEEVQFL